MSFPEEPMDLSPFEGGGYFPATISQKLNNGQYTIVKKLGYGPRSSVWLVSQTLSDEEEYFAIKIYSTAASERAKSVELPVLKTVERLYTSWNILFMHRHFWQKSGAGLHLCLVLNPMGASVRFMQKEAPNKCLSVQVVQRIVGEAAHTLLGLHEDDIMHGAAKPEHIYFFTPTQAERLKPVLLSEPAPKTTKVKKYTTVHSQPLKHDYKWNDKPKKVAAWGLKLHGFGHAQQSIYEPEKDHDYSSAPETLLYEASCTPQTDIWILGYMTYTLLTRSTPFFPKPTISKTIAQMELFLCDSESIPEPWLSDRKLKDYRAVVSGQGYTSSIETYLSDALSKDDVQPAVEFIKACMRLDPSKRLSAKEVTQHEWLAMATACSCRF